MHDMNYMNCMSCIQCTCWIQEYSKGDKQDKKTIILDSSLLCAWRGVRGCSRISGYHNWADDGCTGFIGGC